MMETQQSDEWLDALLMAFAKRVESMERGKTYGWEDEKQSILAELRRRIAIARHKDGEDYKNRLERAIAEADQMARIDENESIRHMLVKVIEFGRDWCGNHNKYVSQCYACQTAKWTKIIAKMYLQSIKERLAQLHEQKSTPEK